MAREGADIIAVDICKDIATNEYPLSTPDDLKETVRLVDDYEIDLLLLDGEASPGGGIGIARQIKDDRDDAPPTCLVIARAADRWLAAYAEVDATLVHPLDPVTTGGTVAELLRTHAPA